jgi:hypothetical protein
LPQRSADVEAIHAREPDVEQDDVGARGLGRLAGSDSIMRQRRFVSAESQEHRQR